MAAVSDQRASLPERLTLEQAVPTLGQLRVALLTQPGPAAVLDASALRECDSSAVAVLLELRRELQQQGKALRLHNGPQRLRDLVALY
ncbi:MAG: STAS domain-containing protein, partial [Hydrogenophaga sp.]|uniref:STAS domain-containing protein n=1 Tax=Hydrogenophaga sp. TaxID=1904254 RepID=UPI003D9B468B